MSYCYDCEKEDLRKKAEARKKVTERGIEYAKAHQLETILIVRTKNGINFKRDDDPDIARFQIIETIIID